MARFNTNQEVVNHVVAHLKKQGRRAGRLENIKDIHSQFVCEYVLPDGSMCAIGACFENPHLIRSFGGVENVYDNFPVMFRETFSANISMGLLQQLQHIHDNAKDGEHFWESIVDALRALCEKYDLDLPAELQDSKVIAEEPPNFT